MHQIIVHNKSHRSQEFEVHGWNDNKNITVGGGKTVKINAADGSSGAIIALHDGHEGEQAEITKGKGNSTLAPCSTTEDTPCPNFPTLAQEIFSRIYSSSLQTLMFSTLVLS